MGYHGGRRKKLLRAFRFTQGDSNAEDLCEKGADGQCTGRATLRWQDDDGHYTTDCPAALIKEWDALISIWFNWKLFGTSEGKGWLDEPALHITIIRLLEGEYNRIQQLRMERGR